MSNSRYYIHVIQAIDDQPLVASQLALFLEDKANTTQDLPYINMQTTNYSRRRIDICDFVIMLVGDSYGAINPSGVSQLHLSYLTAKTKEKPLLILLKSPSSNPRSRQLKNLIDTIENYGPQTLYYYQDDKDFLQALTQGYEKITQEVQQKQWQRLNAASSSSNLSGSNPNASSLGSSSLGASGLGGSSLGASTLNNPNHNSINAGGASLSEFARQNLVTPVFKSGVTRPAKTTSPHIPDSAINPATTPPNTLAAATGGKTAWHSGYNKTSYHKKDKASAPLSEATIAAIVNQSLSDEFEHTLVTKEDDTAQQVQQISLDDTTSLSYSVHAYQDGNLSDVNLTTTVSWRQLLKTLSKMGNSFSSDTMYRCFNDEVAHTAMQSVVKVLPNVHAVSRCMIEPQDFAWIKEQMQFNDWLEPIEVYERSNREFWRLTDKALSQLAKTS